MTSFEDRRHLLAQADTFSQLRYHRFAVIIRRMVRRSLIAEGQRKGLAQDDAVQWMLGQMKILEADIGKQIGMKI